MKWRHRSDPKGEADDIAASQPVTDSAIARGDRALAINGPMIGDISFGGTVIHMPSEARTQPADIDAPPGIDNLPARPGEFVGRATELDRLTATLAAPGPVVVAAVNGLGGIGKSTLVAHWAATHRHGFAPIVWITAESDTEIRGGLVGLATRLQPTVAQVLDEANLAERAVQWLASHTGWLLILDNADDLALVSALLARIGTGGRVVITSRRSSGWQPGTTVLALDVLDPTESLRLLTRLTTVDGPRDLDGAAELCEELGHLPLAIEQAGAYLAQDRFLTPRGYRQLLADHPQRMFEHGGLDTPAERTIARIWRVTLNRIADTEPAAVDLLRMLAWYGPDDIPLALCQPADLDPLTRSTALSVLSVYSMATPDLAGRTVSIHRLVQVVTRTSDLNDALRQPDEIARAHTRAADTLLTSLPDRKDPANWRAWRNLIPHIDNLINNTRTCDDTTTLTIASIRNDSGLFLYNDRAVFEAQAHFHQAFTARERILGPDDTATLTARFNLAMAYGAADRVDDAITLLEYILSDLERRWGLGGSPFISIVRLNLASAYRTAERVDDMFTLLETALADYERILGPNHPSSRVARESLAYAYLDAGRVDDAESTFPSVVSVTMDGSITRPRERGDYSY
ncbi:tetratricopeptide repeat protein [Nocardia sp. NPDC058658]|uniref:tetratricopeptide repeat protein n=1 Tax=Nocardia sp. NPDC058658 TaxID=3346580 RepID=UPI00364B0778